MVTDITKVPILLHIMDSYSWCWNNWYTLFKKYVHNHGPIYFLTEDKAPDFVDEVIHIKSGKGEWGERLLNGLEQIDSNLLFYMQEDFWATNEMVLSNNLLDLFYDLDMETLHIVKHDLRVNLPQIHIKDDLYRFTPKSKFSLNHQFGLWDKDSLIKNIRPHENPWNNEIHGSTRRNLKPHSVYQIRYDWYVTSVSKGKLLPRGEKVLIDNNLV
jgi:hypothetical protein